MAEVIELPEDVGKPAVLEEVPETDRNEEVVENE